MIDLHCHIDLYDEPTQVLARAEKQGIYILSVTTTPKAWSGTKNLSRHCRRVRTSLGMHPQLVKDRSHELGLFEELLPEAQYVGEIGLDKSKHYKDSFQLQLVVFKRIVELCEKEGGKIMSIHSTKAAADVLDVLEIYPEAGPSILHWFTGSLTQVERAASIGCWFSVGPAMLKSKGGQERVKRMPLDRILLETDGPFAKGETGLPLEPIDTIALIDELAAVLGLDGRTTAEVIKKNFITLTSFNLEKPRIRHGLNPSKQA